MSIVPKPWQIIVGFAVLGLAVAAVCYGYQALYDYTKPMNGLDAAVMVASFSVCPPQLLFAMCIDCEVVGWNGVIQYSIVGVLNAALYAGIGAVVVGLKNNHRA